MHEGLNIMSKRSAAKKRTTTKAPDALSLVEDEPKKGKLFASAQPKIGMHNLPELSDPMKAIVESTFTLVDPDRVYEELIKALDARRDALTPGVIRKSLAEASGLYRKAHQLYVVARHDYELFDNEYTVVTSTLREDAKTELEAEKAVGKLKKAITDTDVTTRVARMYPDEYRELQDRAIRARKTIEHLKHLTDVFKNRLRALATLAGTREEL